MKKIFDFFVAAYFSIGNKEYESSLKKGLVLLNFSFSFNCLSLFCCFLPFCCSIPTIGNHLKLQSPSAYVIMLIIVTAIIAFVIKHFLEKNYSAQQYEYIKAFSEKFPRALLIPFVVVHYLGATFLMIYCMKFSLCLIP